MTYFIKIKSKSQNNLDTIINVSNIVKLTPSVDFNSTIITLSTGDVINAEGTFEHFSNLLLSKPELVPQPKLSSDIILDLDKYPADLPRLPSGYVDKRTTAYKEWVEKNPEN